MHSLTKQMEKYFHYKTNKQFLVNPPIKYW